MQIPILYGMFTDMQSNYRVSYPRNMVPTPVDSNISNGYLRPADGIVPFSRSDMPGVDRGGINWNEICYRVAGENLVRVDENGFVTVIGEIKGNDQTKIDYSFDYLAVNSGGRLYLYSGVDLTQITDPDLGTVIDFIWIDGYFLTTDGEFLVTTELNDPFSVNPTKYGSSEIDPDPIVALLSVKNEAHAVNRYTIEVFENIGGTGFPFRRIDGAQIQKGSIGTRSCCVFLDTVAFVGGGKNDSISVYVGVNGNATRIATREIDLILAEYSIGDLEKVVVEAREDAGHKFLYLHLKDQTLVYDASASQATGVPVWFTLDSGVKDKSVYRQRNFTYVYGKWLAGDQKGLRLGEVTTTTGLHFGEVSTWEFSTSIVYNDSKGAIFHELELVCLPGRQTSIDAYVTTDYSLDGLKFSQGQTITFGDFGSLDRRIVFYRNGIMRNYRIQRFSGLSDGRLSVSRLEARLEPLTA